jgi:hypothetical protein
MVFEDQNLEANIMATHPATKITKWGHYNMVLEILVTTLGLYVLNLTVQEEFCSFHVKL